MKVADAWALVPLEQRAAIGRMLERLEQGDVDLASLRAHARHVGSELAALATDARLENPGLAWLAGVRILVVLLADMEIGILDALEHVEPDA